jgi:hypothetical protein
MLWRRANGSPPFTCRKGLQAESAQARASVPVTPLSRVLKAVGAGDEDKAFGLLDAFDQHDNALIALRMDPAFDALRSDSRFIILLACLHLR